MVAAEVDGAPAQPPVKGLDLTEIHRLLRDPDGLADLLSESDCAEAAQVVDDLATHLGNAPQIDAVGFIDELALLFTREDRPGQSSMRNLSRAVAAFVSDLMEFVADDDTEFIVIEFVSTVPLVYGYDFLCKIGGAHGLVRATRGRELDSAERYVSGINAVVHAIEVWRERAQRAIASGYVMEEEDLFLLRPRGRIPSKTNRYIAGQQPALVDANSAPFTSDNTNLRAVSRQVVARHPGASGRPGVHKLFQSTNETRLEIPHM